MRICSAILSIMVFAMAHSALALPGSTIAQYDVGPGVWTPIAESAGVANLTVSTMPKAGLSTEGNTLVLNHYGVWPAGALDPAKYLGLTIKPDAGYQVAFAGQSLICQIALSTATAADYAIAYSRDGFASDNNIITSGSIAGAGPYESVNVSADLSGIDTLTAGTTLAIRFYIYNANGTVGFMGAGQSGTAGPGKPVTIGGVVSAVAVPAAPSEPIAAEEETIAPARKSVPKSYIASMRQRVRSFVRNAFSQ